MLLEFLKNSGYLKNPPHKLWWPNAGKFEVILGVILVQNTRWEQAFIAIDKLRNNKLLSLEKLANIKEVKLQTYINNVGFYKQKSTRIIAICQNILETFGDFDCFCVNVSREWLLTQKGIGCESADSILCYGALRDEMVADNYTYKLLRFYGYELDNYEDIKEWLVSGLLENYESVCKLYNKEIGLNELYARFHGKIVDYCKDHKEVLCQK